jgi:hypothetical protein
MKTPRLLRRARGIRLAHWMAGRPRGDARGRTGPREPTSSATEGKEARAHQLILRIRAEYLELPGLRLTLQQAARLFGTSIKECEPLLTRLVSSRFLKTMDDGTFVRVS